MKKIMIIVLVLVVTMMGCGEEPDDPSVTPVPTQKSSMETLTIYSIDSDTMTLIPVVVEKNKKKYTAEYIAYLVTQNLEDDDIKIDHIEQRDNTVIASFSSKGKPVIGCSKEMETLILNCFAGSLLDNVDNCEKIIYRCDDKAYKSEHRSFERNHVYASE